MTKHNFIKSRMLSAFLLNALLIVPSVSLAEQNKTSSKGENFFYERVTPELVKNGCALCHATGYVRPNVFKYDEFIRRLAIGHTADNNVVIFKMANLRSIAPDMPNHPGGQRCETPDTEPCKSIKAWWEIEFGSQKSEDK